MMNSFDPFPAETRGEPEPEPEVAAVTPLEIETPLEVEENLAASEAEETMTRALHTLKHRGQRAVQAVEHAITPRRVAIGLGVAVGVTALVLFASRRSRSRRRRPQTIAGAVARSLLREAVGRMVLGAAATAGARIAEAAVPMLVASISAHQAKRARPSRARKPKHVADGEAVE